MTSLKQVYKNWRAVAFAICVFLSFLFTFAFIVVAEEKTVGQIQVGANIVTLEWPTIFKIIGIVVTAVIIIVGIVGAILRFFAVKYVEGLIERTASSKMTEITQEFDSKKIELEHDLRRMASSLGAVYSWMALHHYDKGQVISAISAGEGALEESLKVYDKDTTNPDERFRLARRMSNLGYYYALRGKGEERGRAVEYAKYGLEVGREHRDIPMIDCYLFIMAEYDFSSDEERSEWATVYEFFKDDIEVHLESEEDQPILHKYQTIYADITMPGQG